MRWVYEIREANEQSVIAFDGKTLRHSFDGDRKTALHSVSAYATEQKLVLSQSKSKGKKNEVETVLFSTKTTNIGYICTFSRATFGACNS